MNGNDQSVCYWRLSSYVLVRGYLNYVFGDVLTTMLSRYLHENNFCVCCKGSIVNIKFVSSRLDGMVTTWKIIAAADISVKMVISRNNKSSKLSFKVFNWISIFCHR